MNLLNAFKEQLLGFKIKIGSCDSSTFYYVTIFEVDLESDLSMKSLNFVSSINCGTFNDFAKTQNLTPKNKSISNQHSKDFSSISILAKLRSKSIHDTTQIITKHNVTPTDGFGIQGHSSTRITILNNKTTKPNVPTIIFQSLEPNTKNSRTNLRKTNSAKKVSSNNIENIQQLKKLTLSKASFESNNIILKYRKIVLLIRDLHLNNQNKFTSFFFILLLLFCFLCVSVVFYPYLLDLIDKGKNLGLLTLSLRSLQYEITLSASLLFDGCFMNTFDKGKYSIVNDEKIKSKLIIKANLIFENLNTFNQILHKLNIISVIEQFNKLELFNIVKKGSNQYNKTSSLFEELIYYHYFLGYIGRHKGVENCDLNYLIFDKLNHEKEMNYSEIAFYFVTQNLISVILPKISEIYEIIQKEIGQLFSFIILMNSCYISISFLAFVFITFFFYCIFHKLIKSNVKMIDLLISEKEDDVITYRLLSLQKMITNFSYKKCEEYERSLYQKIKPTPTLTIGKQKDFDFDFAPYSPTTKSRKNIKLKGTRSNQNLPLNASGSFNSSLFHNNSTSENLLGSIGGNGNKKLTSKKTLQKSTYYQKETTNQKTTHSIIETKSLKDVLEENGENVVINYEGYLTKNLHLIQCFNFIMIIFVGITLSILGGFTILNIQEIKNSKKLISIGVTYVNKISLQVLIGFIYKNTILNFNPYQGNFNSLNDYQNGLSENYYKISPKKNSSIYNILNQTIYSLILARYDINIENIKKFKSETGNKSPLLKVKSIIDRMNSNSFCFYLSQEYVKTFHEYFNISNFLDFIDIVNLSVTECKFIGGGFLEIGLTSSMDGIINEMNEKYSEFMIAYQNNNSNFALSLLLDENIVKFNLIFDYPYDLVEMIVISEIETEFENKFKIWKRIDKICIILFIIFDILFVFSGYFVVHRLSMFYNLLFHVANRIKDSLRNE